MANKKMAIKKQPKQRKLNLEFARAGKASARFILVIGLFVSSGWIAVKGLGWYADVWPVKQVSLENESQYFSKQELIQFLNQNQIKGMWAIDLAVLQQRVKSIDWVKKVEIRKIWPDHLSFYIEEHQPVARFGEYVLTQAGTKIAQGKKAPLLESLPKIELVNANQTSAQSYAKIWQEYKSIRRQFELLDLKLSKLEVDQINNWLLHFESGIGVNLGRKAHLERVDKLVQVYNSIENRKALKSIDLRYHNGFAVEWQLKEDNSNTKKLKS